MPPARTVLVPGRGEFFIRDTGGDGPPAMLLHGWMASADLNWCGAYTALTRPLSWRVHGEECLVADRPGRPPSAFAGTYRLRAIKPRAD